VDVHRPDIADNRTQLAGFDDFDQFLGRFPPALGEDRVRGRDVRPERHLRSRNRTSARIRTASRSVRSSALLPAAVSCVRLFRVDSLDRHVLQAEGDDESAEGDDTEVTATSTNVGV